MRDRAHGELGRWWEDDSGATAVEYAIMVGGIATVIVGVVTLLGEAVVALFANVRW